MEDEQKKKAASREELRRKSVQDEITVMKSNKRKLESSVDVLLREADEFAQQAEKTTTENGLDCQVKCL